MQWKAETRAVIFEHRKKIFSKDTTNYRDSDHYHCYKEKILNRINPINIVSLRAIINNRFL